MRFLLRSLPLACALLATACTAVYKLDIPQGNLVDKNMVDSLKPGMTRRQVALIMGTPSIQDPFHQNRWDYAASYQQRGGKIEKKDLTLYFDDNVLARLEGNYFEKREDDLIRSATRVRGRELELEESSKQKKKKAPPPPDGG
jgi:outer membrane protein assembly factor BamE